MGEGYDMHTIRYRATTIMRGEPGDLTIVKAITVVATHRCSHDIVKTLLGQSGRRGVHRVMLSAAKLVICLLENGLPWLSLYE